MAQFIRITKREAKKLFGQGDKMFFICPCKLRPGFPWNVAAMVCGKEYLENAARYSPQEDGRTSDLWKGNIVETGWDLLYNNWAYYNATYETGYYAHYYVQR